MAQTKELEKIKKEYGERFMQMCRTLFPTLLETEGRLYEILSGTFAGNSKTLYEDIASNGLEEEFKNFIYSKIDVEDEEKKIIIEEKSPYELLEEAGYDLIECKTEDEIQNFKKYYAPEEDLCMYRNLRRRLNRCVVFFAVKKDVENIKREDFDRPKREDEYGSSVLGIQFTKNGMCTVSIINRYNNTVNNPDATYGNDLDRIVPGLEQSFKNLLRQRGLELNNVTIQRFEIPRYTVANDGKYYKYEHEGGEGIYFCSGNIIIENGEPRKLDPDKKLLIDYFEVDIENKTIKNLDPDSDNDIDSFTDDLQEIKKIKVEKIKDEKGARRIIIEKEDCEHPVIITIDEDNQIIGYKNENLTEVGDGFLQYNKRLRKLELPNLVKTGDGFLQYNEDLSELVAPNLTEVGDAFLAYNKALRELELPNLVKAGEYFLFHNEDLSELVAPNLTEVEGGFLFENKCLRVLIVPNLVKAEYGTLMHNEVLYELVAPNLTELGVCSLCYNKSLTRLELPNLIEARKGTLMHNEVLYELVAPYLTEVEEDYFLVYNKNREKFLKMIKANKEKQEREKRSKITPNDITHLDKTAELRTSEISETQGVMQELLDERKNEREEEK